MVKLTQQYIIRKPSAADRFVGYNVHIWSGEWSAYWRSDGSGYTNDVVDAGVYSWDDAWRRTSHCGPEKKIEFRRLDP